ncbi:MAG: hypothetical protein EDM79_18865 [Chloroflexi bacterium]|nr:MAG: hypothetical protein EDM79_18865 [Chloroflexota bacterium]MCE7858588.1 hypothetical protein [Chloroflexi bacterium CFX2]
MKTGTCPKCGSNEIIKEALLQGSDSIPPYISISEPEPPNRPFVWMPKNEQSQFTAYVCGACGYSEFYAVRHQALNEGRKRGFKAR